VNDGLHEVQNVSPANPPAFPSILVFTLAPQSFELIPRDKKDNGGPITHGMRYGTLDRLKPAGTKK